MKKISRNKLSFAEYPVILAAAVMMGAGCKKNDITTLPANAQNTAAISLDGFQEVNLVANKAAFGAAHVDHKLINAWGMSSSDGGKIWVSAADAGLSFIYNKKGGHELPPVSIPSHDPNTPGAPTGNIFNATADFVIPGTNAASKFIFASEDGTISAWNGGDKAVIVADRSGYDASYKGLAMAQNGGANFLYVTNFSSGKIDVFDKDFHFMTDKRFVDPDLPAGYSPFNIRNLHGMLYVTYALRTADGDEDSTGAGLGFVNVFWPNGTLAKHFAAHGTLNAPWGIAEAHPDFCGANGILIGNFGDGHINVFDFDGNFKGQLMNGNNPVTIDGLWAIDNEIPGITAKQLYFTAGPNDESDGLFGFLLKQ